MINPGFTQNNDNIVKSEIVWNGGLAVEENHKTGANMNKKKVSYTYMKKTSEGNFL